MYSCTSFSVNPLFINYFHVQIPARYVDEITQERFEDFIIGD